jgi:hypothetical protein
MNWTTWPTSHIGPMITYMAKVPASVNVTAWTPGTAAVWFKIDQAGKSASGAWAATDGLTATNSVYTFKIPATLPAGQYLIRHEMYVGKSLRVSSID